MTLIIPLAKLNIDWSTVRREIFDLVATFDEPLSKSVPFVSNAGIELSNRAVKKHGKEVAKKIRTFVEEYEMAHYHDYEPNHELLNFIRNNKQTYIYYMWTSNGIRTIQDFLNKESLSSYLMIGDSPSDKNAAKNADIDFFEIDYFARH